MSTEKQYYIRKNTDMQPFNSMKLKFNASIMVQPYSEEGVRQAFKDFSDKRIIPLGVGSNSIFVQKEYNDDVVILSTQFLNSIQRSKHGIVAESGATMSKLAWFALESHLDNFWFMEDIPGSVGGGIIMNAGTHDGCISDVIKSVRFYNAETDEFEEYSNNDIFVFRNSIFSEKKGLIISGLFDGKEGNYDDVVKRMTNQKTTRYLKQPRDFPSAGSVFKTPIIDGKSVNCWMLLRDSHLAGYSIGGAQVSPKHSGFIINTGNATGSDLKKLVDYCISEVEKHTGVTLEPEWRFIY